MLPLYCGCNRCCFPVLPLLSFSCWLCVFVRFQCYPQVDTCAVSAPLPLLLLQLLPFFLLPLLFFLQDWRRTTCLQLGCLLLFLAFSRLVLRFVRSKSHRRRLSPHARYSDQQKGRWAVSSNVTIGNSIWRRPKIRFVTYLGFEAFCAGSAPWCRPNVLGISCS